MPPFGLLAKYRDVYCYGFNLLRQRLEFCLPFFDRSPDFVQRVAHFESPLGESVAGGQRRLITLQLCGSEKMTQRRNGSFVLLGLGSARAAQ